ncbi:hypothetical protein Xhom_00805 [Xenorhabdus hominickii]|uniref:Uncharacterized protein n=1 Tax=Xenorhabdus hominickii TaxID=351679 RepID=A0A2G0QEZ7_XENHO|nr:hypothetical protein Xhom_00805 [Xenorhabdus hominickii]
MKRIKKLTLKCAKGDLLVPFGIHNNIYIFVVFKSLWMSNKPDRFINFV